MKALSRIHQRVSSLARQRGFLRLSMLIPRWGSKGFSVQDGFRQNEPGIHLETYDPNTILKRRNLLLWSEDLSQWGKAATASVTLNAATAPDGTNSADLFTSTANFDFVNKLAVVYRGAGSTYAASVYLKAGASQLGFVQIGSTDSVDTARVHFNLGTGALTSSAVTGTGVLVGSGIEPVGNGWYRIWVAGRSNNTSNVTLLVSCNTTLGSFYIWGGQLELDSAPSPYQKVTDWNTEFLAAGGDRVTMFQEPACITPVTAVEQVIGGFISSERGTVRGPEIWNDAAVTFVNGSSRVSAGVYRIYSPTGAETADLLLVGITPNRYYEVTFNVDSVTAAGGGIRVAGNNVIIGATVGPKRCIALCDTNALAFKRVSGTTDVQISGVSFKALPGSVATQSTAGFKPKLEARVNALRSTAAFGSSPWTTNLVPTVTDNAATTPSGAAATRFQTAAINAGKYQTTDVSFPATSIRLRWVFKDNGGVDKNVLLGVGQGSFGGVGGDRAFRFDPSTGAVSNANAAYTSITPRSLGSGWWEVIAFITTTSASTFTASVYGTGNCDFFVGEPDVRTAADAALDIPAYQRVNTASDYDTEGFPHRCRGDGSDDYLSVPMNMSTVNAVDVWITGNLKQSDATAGALIELTSSSTATAGSFGMISPNPGNGDVQFRSGGTTPGVSKAPPLSTYLGPLNAVAAGSADIAAPSVSLDVNGVSVGAPNTASQGAGNFANDTLYILRRGGSTLPSNAGFCALTIRGARSDAGFKARMLRLHARLSKIKV